MRQAVDTPGRGPLGSLSAGVGLTYTPTHLTYINAIPYLRQPSGTVYDLREQGVMVNRVSGQGGDICRFDMWVCVAGDVY